MAAWSSPHFALVFYNLQKTVLAAFLYAIMFTSGFYLNPGSKIWSAF